MNTFSDSRVLHVYNFNITRNTFHLGGTSMQLECFFLMLRYFSLVLVTLKNYERHIPGVHTKHIKIKSNNCCFPLRYII